MEKVKKHIREYAYLYLCFLIFILLDFSFRIHYSDVGLYLPFDLVPLFFSIGWSLFFTFLVYLIQGVSKKIFMIIIVLIFSIYIIAQNVYFNLFDKFFSFFDLSLAGEGLSFVDISYFQFDRAIIISVVISLILLAAALYLSPKEKKKISLKIAIVLMLCSLGCYGMAKYELPDAEDSGVWDSVMLPGNIYRDFTNTTKALSIASVYEYTIRDIAMVINPIKKVDEQKTISELDEYFENQSPIISNNEYSGIYEGKNLFYILMENIDNWMITPENMPALYYARENGIDFVNHYSASFATGRTFNTEFMLNTSLIPPLNGQAPSYIYSKNSFPFSIANQFSNSGYSVNSFHENNGNIYNRSQIHSALGYEKYHNDEDMNMENGIFDSQLINGYDVMVQDTKYMNFLITYSAHSPFTYEKEECQKNLTYVQSFTDSDDEKYLCGLSQSHETDLFFQQLFRKMEEDQVLDDAVFVFVTDHYAYGALDADVELALKGTSDPNLLQNTPFFIWSKDTKAQKIEKVTATVDVLPTVLNLFGIKNDQRYYTGRDAFSDDPGFVFFADGSWYDGNEYWNSNSGENSDYEKEMNQYISNKLNVSWRILNSNYFKTLESK